MKQLTSIDRDQIQFTSLEMMVGSESMVRVIDNFLECIDPKDLGFVTFSASMKNETNK